jgi:RNA polymerase sigma-70 factor (ECF subfamily)
MPSPLRTRSQQDSLLLLVFESAREFAAAQADADDAEDIASEVVSRCIAKLRSRRWGRVPKNPGGFVRKLTNDATVDFHRRKKAEHRLERLFEEARLSDEPEWLSVEREWDEASIDEYQAQVMDTLPRRCKLAYYLVRVEGDTYAEAAGRMGVSARTVGKYIVRAHAAFRRDLRLLGVEVMPRDATQPPPDRKAQPNDAAEQVTDAPRVAIDPIELPDGRVAQAARSRALSSDRTEAPADGQKAAGDAIKLADD